MARTRQPAANVMIVLATLAGVAAPLHAQSVYDSVRTGSGYCHLWEMPPGGSDFPQDASFARCALDRPPVLRHAPPVPAPRIGFYAGGSFLIVVNADGSVDQERTRASTMGEDREFHERALETLRRWHFDPGVRDGKPVRSAFPLWIVSNTRNDTLPSRLEWRYANGVAEDTLVGTWIVQDPLPPLDQNQGDAVHTAVVRELVRMQVVFPVNERHHCLVLPGKDSVEHVRVTALLRGTVPELASASALDPYGCEREAGVRRLVLPDVRRTENGRIVLRPTGDDLPSWPPGYAGRSWRAWTARCVVQLPQQGEAVRAVCGVGPAPDADAYAAWRDSATERVIRLPGARPTGDSVRVAVYARTSDAYGTDTLQAVVGPLPRLDQRAILDPSLPCGGWSAHSAGESDVYVVSGDPAGTSMYLTRASATAAPVSRSGRMRCGSQEPRIAEFAAFLLGDVGARPTGPVTLCFSRCARSYVLDPARHTLVDRAQIRFRLADLRPVSRTGEQLMFRIVVDPAPANLLPLVVLRSASGPPTSAWVLTRAGPNAWDHRVSYGDGYPLDTEVYLYLIARE